jgi:hypothetical protein
MPTANDFPARGKITAIRGDVAVFNPAGTTYELHLVVGKGFEGPLNVPVEVLIRVVARKVWTVPSGGAFVQPIFGPPRIIQGRVRYVTDTELVVHAGATFVVALHPTETAIELPEGPISVLNNLVNVTAMPGARMELASAVGVG